MKTIEIDHAKMVSRLKKNGSDIMDGLDDQQVDGLHMLIGLIGEVGELTDAIKKCVIYGQPLDVENVIEELGDIEFYLEGLRQNLDISREQTLEANTNKLRKRYGNKYSDEAAKERKDKQDVETDK